MGNEATERLPLQGIYTYPTDIIEGNLWYYEIHKQLHVAMPVQFNLLPNQSSNLAILAAVLHEELVSIKATVC